MIKGRKRQTNDIEGLFLSNTLLDGSHIFTSSDIMTWFVKQANRIGTGSSYNFIQLQYNMATQSAPNLGV